MVQFRAPVAELEAWKKQSSEEGRTLSGWIRGRCNGGQVSGDTGDRATEWAPSFRARGRRDGGGAMCKHGARLELCRHRECRTAS